VDDQLAVLKGAGDGTFGISALYSNLACSNGDVVIADLSGDGLPDLVVPIPLFGGSDVGVLLNLGSGVFDGPAFHDAGPGQAMFVGAGDFDEDGLADLVVAEDSPAGLTFIPGTGGGAFGTPSNVAVGSCPISLDVGHVDADGHLDVIVGDQCTGDVHVMLGAGDGTFTTTAVSTSGFCSYHVQLADVDLDGANDLIVADLCAEHIAVVPGNGDGTFGVPATYAGMSSEHVRVADVDQDGWPDIVATDPYGEHGSGIVLLRNAGGGIFEAARWFAASASGESLVVVDLDGDGLRDVATVSFSSDSLSILLNRAAGP
jgi:hypothetical protein